ncbi:hypothetical protein [Evansella cellulosilytica]|uniref:ABC-2 family transporter protein n=1 Tax=Evansella cellulosilytica (strain ATCC 21833 / DSM 2522 / FERM P-1141 / JCM 9156 / N-4) TaxID=649639 RepID=E6TQK4_EVAC2|nr:hypothetical protein [Evansella cellulosilytica]ADU30515.1 hypothetical protein Bcell_2255 [Evansella cellulosilytica DSM 2522]
MVLKLTLFEWKQTSIWNYILITVTTAVFATFALFIIGDGNVSRRWIALDTLYIVLGIAIQICRHPSFVQPTSQKGSDIHILMRKLPLKNKDILYSRYLNSTVLHLCVYTVFFLIILLFSTSFFDLVETNYLQVLLLLVCAGVFISSLYAAMESGVNIKPTALAAIGGLLSIPILILLNILYAITDGGVIVGLIRLTHYSPLFAIVLAMVVLLLSLLFWQSRTKKSMKRVDFHV